MVLYEPINLVANPPDGDKGDITVSGGGTVFTIDPNVVTNAQLAQMPSNTVKGNLTNATANAQDVTIAALTAAITGPTGTAYMVDSLGSVLPNSDALASVTVDDLLLQGSDFSQL